MHRCMVALQITTEKYKTAAEAPVHSVFAAVEDPPTSWDASVQA